MSVVLRGIDKPSDCDYCPFQSDSYCSLLLSYIIVEHGVDPRCLISEISGYTLKNGHRVVISVDDEGRERHEIHLDRKTESNSEKPNNCEGEPQTDCPWK